MQERIEQRTVNVVPMSQVPRRNFCRAAEIRIDFDHLARRLGAAPSRGTFKDGLVFPKRYRSIGLALPHGRFATLSQTEMRQAVIEIGLELSDGDAFHLADLAAVTAALGVDEDYVERLNEFRWLSPEPEQTRG